jgi:crotonobetaine/carnitine-CoA ligase
MPPTDGSQGVVGPFLQRAAAEPARLFATFEGAPLTFAGLAARSAAFAAALRAAGVARGDAVAVMLRNSTEALAVVLGIARAGAVWVPLNVQQRGEGLRYILDHATPTLVVIEDDLIPTLEDCRALVPGRIAGGALPALLDTGAAFAENPPDADDLLAISYTSGTTGPPKGVLVTHRMLRLAGEAVALIADVRAGDVLFHWEPLFHIGGSQMLVLPLIRDCRLAMVARFSASGFWEQVRAARATHVHYLGAVLHLLLKQPPSPEDTRHGVRVAWGGGCPETIWREVESRFGVRLRECYGMTEASSITTANTEGVVGAVGRPVPWFEVELLDEDGRPVPQGARGEIVVRSSVLGALTRGYFRNPEVTARTLRDGALWTGDIGSWGPEGSLRFHGRRTDSLRCRGENVSAWEVEHVAATHPDVEDCAVIGVAAEIGEQDIKIFLQAKAGTVLDAAAFSAWLTPRLAPYQNPRYVAVVREFERTPSQRIMKHRLSRALDDCWDRLAR